MNMTTTPKKFVPYLSAEVAFLSFANDFKDYKDGQSRQTLKTL